MPSYFPRQSVAWKLEEPSAFRKLSLSLVEMAAITGIVMRLYRAVVVANAAETGWLYLGGTFALGAIFLLGMLTLHLGNFPIRRWLWRAPAFAAIAIAFEMLTSLALIAIGREPYGSGRADYHEWLPMLRDTALLRSAEIAVFALVLAGVVQIMRVFLLKKEDREHTLEAVADANTREA